MRITGLLTATSLITLTVIAGVTCAPDYASAQTMSSQTQMRSGDNGSMQNGTMQNRTLQNGTVPMDNGDMRSGSMKTMHSQPSQMDSVGDDAIPALALEPQTSNGVTYINGGVSDEELAELKSKGSDYNLHILLSAASGEYIGDVALKVLDAKGKELVSINDAGPYVYANLKPGKYVLEASTGGASKKFPVNVSGKGSVKKQISLNEQGGISSPHTPSTKLQ